MELNLSEDDIEQLRNVLDSVVRDLSHEIADTDNSGFRANLKQRRDTLRSILDRIGGPLPDRP